MTSNTLGVRRILLKNKNILLDKDNIIEYGGHLKENIILDGEHLKDNVIKDSKHLKKNIMVDGEHLVIKCKAFQAIGSRVSLRF